MDYVLFFAYASFTDVHTGELTNEISTSTRERKMFLFLVLVLVLIEVLHESRDSGIFLEILNILTLLQNFFEGTSVNTLYLAIFAWF